MLKEEKNEGHDIFARETNNKMTICINACLHKAEKKKHQLQCTSNQFPNIKTKHNAHKTTKTQEQKIHGANAQRFWIKMNIWCMYIDWNVDEMLTIHIM